MVLQERGTTRVLQLGGDKNELSVAGKVGPKPNGSSAEEKCQCLEFPEGMLSCCTWAQDTASSETQKENWLISGLKDFWYLSCHKRGHIDASGLTTNTHCKAIGCNCTSQTTAMQQLLDLLSRPVAEFTYNRKL